MGLLTRLKRLFVKRKPTVYHRADQRCYHCGTWASRVGGWTSVLLDTPHRHLATMECRWCDKSCVFVDIGVGWIKATETDIKRAQQSGPDDKLCYCGSCRKLATLANGWTKAYNVPYKGMRTLTCTTCAAEQVQYNDGQMWSGALDADIERHRVEQMRAMPRKN